MYRQYENPYVLENRLSELESELESEIANGKCLEDLADLYYEIDEVKERINFAWQDDAWNTDMEWTEDTQLMCEDYEIRRSFPQYYEEDLPMETVTEFIGYDDYGRPIFESYECVSEAW